MDIKRNGTQPSGKGPAEWFTGTVRIDPLFKAPDPARVSGASVTFEPGARTAWHTHPLGQTLIVTAGSGRLIASQAERQCPRRGLNRLGYRAAGVSDLPPITAAPADDGAAGLGHFSASCTAANRRQSFDNQSRSCDAKAPGQCFGVPGKAMARLE